MKKRLFMVFLALAVFLTSCIPGPVAQSADAPNIETIVAATYAAISAQTKVAEALFTATPENTPTATNTPLPPTVTLTFTPTFVISTATPIPTNTAVVTNTPDLPPDFKCEFLKSTPENGSTMGPKNGFDWVPKVGNRGTEDWKASDIEFVYVSGDKFSLAKKYNLWKDVPVGKNIELGVDMIAPKEKGTYSTTWALKRGDRYFCQITLKIIVK
jgi:hypothetical protein